MSVGPSQPSGYIFPASIAGAASRNLSETSQAKGDQSVQNLRSGQDRLADKDIGDVLETNLSADRDVDGRLPYELPPEAEQEQAETTDGQPEDDASKAAGRSQDPEHERGLRLDLDA